ncbi:sigma-70 family RNA polymerase sigma factor [Maribius pontilimi]|uniref:Sigma-70 family RNA polymerase sigma factor n=1 Tax=Palleronia pontilimi TaxID=1964209 RepID=A0A934IIM7_9RHOB|nr:sigma-70 family RNA polymerase sigma factor [Palleronia pontilimi]MBJ3763601.1 sigma-70 family RNA polymerase sigma factor [Palleronia pontilimi]
MDDPRDLRWANLLRRANRGERQAYLMFLREIAPVLRGVIVARGGARIDDSEDILQNTLIAIHEKRYTWRDGDPVAPWLYSIARYKTADAFRQRRRNRADPLDGVELTTPDDATVDPSVSYDLDRLLAGLDDTSAHIVREMKLRGASAAETGAPLGMSAGAVRVALHRALARLSSRVGQPDAPPRTSKEKTHENR